MRLSARFINAGFSLLSGLFLLSVFLLSAGVLLLLLTAGQTAAYARSPEFPVCGAALSPWPRSCEISAAPQPPDALPESFISPGTLMLAKGGLGGGLPAPRPAPKPSQKPHQNPHQKSKPESSGNWGYSSSGSPEKSRGSGRYGARGISDQPFDECEWCEDCSDPECEDCEDCEE